MYLQITTRCNMVCPHCCYSCLPGKGQHMTYSTAVDAIVFACSQDDSSVAIGGGEPTLHPRFFDILRLSLDSFDYVWMATNGSKTKSMYRLASIIDGCDEPECGCEGDDLDYCDHYIDQEGKLSVALSQDHFHDSYKVNDKIVDLWTRRANQHRHSHYEIRDVSRQVAAQGRAKKTGSGWGEHCVL